MRKAKAPCGAIAQKNLDPPISQIYFVKKFLHVSDSSSVHHQEFIHCTLSNGICDTAFEQYQDATAVPSWSCSKAVSHIPLLNVQ